MRRKPSLCTLPSECRQASAKNGEFTSTLPQMDPDAAEVLQFLVEEGWVTCTRGEPGDAGATYALGWIQLDEPELYSPEVRERHARNMLRWNSPLGSA